MPIGRSGWASTGRVFSRLTLYAKSGHNRRSFAHYVDSIEGSANMIYAHSGGVWLNSADNITHLVVDFGGGTFTGRVSIKKGR
jgi:hypothetical protein